MLTEMKGIPATSRPHEPERDSPRRRIRKASSSAVKLEDVARLADVSTASVSRTLNAPHLVSQHLRDRVMKAVAELNWVPNGPAKALASLRTRTVGALIPTLGHQNFATLVERMQRDLGKARYTLLIGCVGNSAELRIQQGAKMIEQGVEFLVLVGEAQPPALFEMLSSRNVAYAITYTSGKQGTHTCIGYDNYAAACRVAEHLLDLGHRDFAMMTQPEDMNDRIQQRIAGAKDTLAKAGVAVRPQHLVQGDGRTIASGRAAFGSILAASGDIRPTALICTNDYLASGALIEAKAARIKVPEQLSVTGFDDTDMSAHLDPPLTTVRVPGEAMGAGLATYILRLLEDGMVEIPPPMDAALIVRESTAPPSSAPLTRPRGSGPRLARRA